jgi:NADPH:quinone reductase-like Zn-dependent oxidoreductase
MLAATIRDGAITVQEHPDPEPEAGELLVRVRAAGLNGADMLQVSGNYPPPPGVPSDIPGLELAGEVVAVGRDVLRFEPGDRVMAVVAGAARRSWRSCTSGPPCPSRRSWTGPPRAACPRCSPPRTTRSSPRPG